MILEAGFIYCKRRGIEYSDDKFMDEIFMSDELSLKEDEEFDNICKDLRSYRHIESYKLIEISDDEYEKCIDEFGEH